MNERSITYLSDAFLITCVLQKELAEDVLAAAKKILAHKAQPLVMRVGPVFENGWDCWV